MLLGINPFEDGCLIHQVSPILQARFTFHQGHTRTPEQQGNSRCRNDGVKLGGEPFLTTVKEGRRSLRPYQQLRRGIVPAGLKGQRLIALERRLLKSRVPFLTLINVTLNHAHRPWGSRILPVAHHFQPPRTVAPGRSKAGHEQQQPGQPAPRAPHQSRQHRTAQHHQPAHSVDSGQVGHLNQRLQRRLGVSQIGPGKTGNEMRPNQLQRHPHPRQPHHPPPRMSLPGACNQSENTDIECYIAAEQHQHNDGEGLRDAAELMDGDGDPVERTKIMDQSAKPAQPKGLSSGSVAHRQQQRHQGYPGKAVQTDFREPERQQNPARTTQ